MDRPFVFSQPHQRACDGCASTADAERSGSAAATTGSVLVPLGRDVYLHYWPAADHLEVFHFGQRVWGGRWSVWIGRGLVDFVGRTLRHHYVVQRVVHHLASTAKAHHLGQRGPDSARATGNSQTGTVCFAYQHVSVSPDALWYVGRSRALPYDRLHAVGRRRDRPGCRPGVLHDLY